MLADACARARGAPRPRLDRLRVRRAREPAVPRGRSDRSRRSRSTGAPSSPDERAVLAASPDFLVVRTSWVFGTRPKLHRGRAARRRRRGVRSTAHGPAAGGRRPARVGRPTPWTSPRRSSQLVERSARAVSYHLANAGIATWLGRSRASRSTRPAHRRPRDRARIEDASTLRTGAAARWIGARLRARAASLGVTLRPWQEAVTRLPGSPTMLAAAHGRVEV